MIPRSSPTVLVLCLALAACGAEGDGKGDGTASGTTGLDEETQEMLDELLVAVEGYESWDQVDPGMIETPGGIHGEAVQIWWNDLAYDTVQAQAGGDMPTDAIIVKQGYEDAAGTTPKTTTMMWKADGYGWFWAQLDDAGDTMDAGTIDGCVNCHESAPQDYVYSASW